MRRYSKNNGNSWQGKVEKDDVGETRGKKRLRMC